MKSKRLLPLLIILISLAGCFEVEQQLIILKDGSSEYKLITVFSESLLLMQDTTEAEICDNNLKNTIDSYSLSFTSSQFQRGDDFVCTISIKGTFEELLKLIQSGEITQNAPSRERVNSQNGIDLLKIEKISNSAYKLISQIKPEEEQTDVSEFKLIELMFTGRNFIFSLEAPNITKSSSRITNNASKTRVEIPITNLFMNKEVYFETIFELGEYKEDPFKDFLK
tara:strand:+ start:152 stop:826 length:675 start_codon:yes stop_codon:yes gene_type:complete